jgi:hypothetical protein
MRIHRIDTFEFSNEFTLPRKPARDYYAIKVRTGGLRVNASNRSANACLGRYTRGRQETLTLPRSQGAGSKMGGKLSWIKSL